MDKACSRWAQSFQSGLTLIIYQSALLLYLISCHIHTLSVLVEGVLKWNSWYCRFTHFTLHIRELKRTSFKKKKCTWSLAVKTITSVNYYTHLFILSFISCRVMKKQEIYIKECFVYHWKRSNCAFKMPAYIFHTVLCISFWLTIALFSVAGYRFLKFSIDSEQICFRNHRRS